MKKKNILLAFCAAALGFAPMTLSARYDGAYLHDITMDVETPHYDWMTDLQGGAVKAFVLTAPQKARDIVELKQRMALDTKIVVIHPHPSPNGHGYGSTSSEMTPVEGTMPAERKAAILEGFGDGSGYEIVILHGGVFKKMPPEFKYKLMNFVRNGGGLMISGLAHYYTRPEMYFPKKFLERELPEFATAATPDSRVFKVCGYGKGRIGFLSWAMPKKDANDVGLWRQMFETEQVSFMNAILQIAGRDPEVKISFNPEKKLDGRILDFVKKYNADEKNKNNPIDITDRLPPGTRSICFNAEGKGSYTFALRLRDGANQILFEGKVKAELDGITPVMASLPVLPDGKYVLDIRPMSWGKTICAAAYPFEVESSLGKTSLTGAESIPPGQNLTAVFRTQKPMSADGVLKIELFDSPMNNLWYQSEIPYKAGYSANITIPRKDFHMPTRAGVLTCTLLDKNGARIAKTSRVLFFPDYKIDTYLECGNPPQNPNLAPMMADNNNRYRIGLWGGRNATIMNQQILPWVTSIHLADGGKGNTVCGSRFISKDPDSLWVKYDHDINPYNPEVLEQWKKQNEKLMNTPDAEGLASRAGMGAVIYNLGDENGFDYTAGYGMTGDKYYREFLKKQYGTIANLNTKWGTDYKDFEAVPHPKLHDATKPELYTLWFAQRQYMERMYADLMSEFARQIKRTNPHAMVGAEGSSHGDLELTIRDLGFWGPYADKVTGQLLRSIGGKRVRTFWWGGYIGQMGGRNSLPYPLWTNLLPGSYDGHMWFLSEPGNAYSNLAADYTFAQYVRDMLPSMNELSNGLAQLLITTPFGKESEIALYFSHASDSAAQLNSRFHTADMSNGMIDYFYEKGINFHFVTKNSLSELKKAKIIFLTGGCALSDAEIAAIRTRVNEGAVLVGGINPGLMNECYKLHKENPMKDMFGDIVFDKISEPANRKVVIDAELGAEKIHYESDSLKITPEVPVFQIRKVGKGTAILLNFTLAGALNSEKIPGSFNAMFDSILKFAGITPEYRLETPFPMNQRIFRVRSAKDFDLLGFLCLQNDRGQNVRIRLPGRRFVYEAKKGFVGETDTISFNTDMPFRVYSVFTEKQKKPEVRLSSGEVGPCGSVKLDLSANPPERIYYVRTIGPDGKVLNRNTFVIETKKTPGPELFFSYSDPEGKYRCVLQDAATGLETEFTIRKTDR